MALTEDRLRRIASALPEVVREAQRRASLQYRTFVLTELRLQHTTGRSIYGDRYARPKSGGQPLTDTHELEQGYVVTVRNGGRELSVDNVSDHTIVDHDGKHTMLPDERGVPPRWEAKLRNIHQDQLAWMSAQYKLI